MAKKKTKTSLDRFLEKKPTLREKVQALETKVIVLQDQIDEINVKLLHAVFYPEQETINENNP